MNYLALPCRRERQFEGQGGWGRGLKVRIEKSPVASCGPGLQRAVALIRRIVDQILHHPAWAAAGMSHPGLGCWAAGGMGRPGLLGLMPCCWGLDSEREGLAVVSHARRSEEVGGLILIPF